MMYGWPGMNEGVTWEQHQVNVQRATAERQAQERGETDFRWQPSYDQWRIMEGRVTREELAEYNRTGLLPDYGTHDPESQAIDALYMPYQQAGEAATGQLESSLYGGEIDYAPSRLSEVQLQRGRKEILGQQAARGSLKSSRTQERLAEMRAGVGGEEADRFYADQIQMLGLSYQAAQRNIAQQSQLSQIRQGTFQNSANMQSQQAYAQGQRQQALGYSIGQGIQNYWGK